MKGGRLEWLDCARAIAALLVLVEHTIEHVPGLGQYRTGMFSFGQLGVVLFFFISGYVIPRSLHRFKSVPGFLIGRSVRIMPLYYASFLAATIFPLIDPAILFGPNYDPHNIKHLLHSFLFLNGVSGVPAAVGVYWTLGIEWMFYFFCCALWLGGVQAKVTRNHWVFGIFLIAVGAALPVILAMKLPIGLRFLLIFAAMTGWVLSELDDKKTDEKAWRLALGLYLVTAGAIWYAAVGSSFSQNAIARRDFDLLWSYLAAPFLFLVCRKAFSEKSPRVLVHLGKISYSIYITHVFALFVAIRISPSGWIAPITYLLTWGLSELTYRFIEEPSQVWGKRVVKPYLKERETATFADPNRSMR